MPRGPMAFNDRTAWGAALYAREGMAQHLASTSNQIRISSPPQSSFHVVLEPRLPCPRCQHCSAASATYSGSVPAHVLVQVTGLA